MRKIAGEHPFYVLPYMNSYIFHICFVLFILLSYLIFDFVCLTLSLAKTHGIAKYAHTYIQKYIHTRTHKKKHTQKGRKKRRRNNNQETTVTHFGEDKGLHLESSKQNYYTISIWVIIKAIFIHSRLVCLKRVGNFLARLWGWPVGSSAFLPTTRLRFVLGRCSTSSFGHTQVGRRGSDEQISSRGLTTLQQQHLLENFSSRRLNISKVNFVTNRTPTSGLNRVEEARSSRLEECRRNGSIRLKPRSTARKICEGGGWVGVWGPSGGLDIGVREKYSAYCSTPRN